MKNLLPAMCIVTAFTVGTALSAQSGAMDKRPMDGKDMMKDGQMTVSGCVAAGKDAGQYMLTNAMMMGKEMTGKEMTGKDKMTDPAMGAGHMMSYELVGGGSDLKAHMGHKVEVSGKMDMDRMKKMDADSMGKMDKMDKMSDTDMKAMKAMKLNVKSVRMVSATCQ